LINEEKRLLQKIYFDSLEKKNRLIQELESELPIREINKATRDPHKRRKPRPCGLTIHTGIGCNYGCLYCYVPDIVKQKTPTEYPLEPKTLFYSIITNPYFLPGEHGTLLAIGSITEPFLTNTITNKTIEFLKTIKEKNIENPVQIATKKAVNEALARQIKEVSPPNLNILVTITTFKKYRILEPRAPPPQKRFDGISNLSKKGIIVDLFLRPIIPRLTDNDEIDILLNKAKESGARGVVAGSLRINLRILKKLEKVGLEHDRNVLKLLSKKTSITLDTRNQKSYVKNKSSIIKLSFYPSSCSANLDTTGISCTLCNFGPCISKRPTIHIEEKDVKEILEFEGIKTKHIAVGKNHIKISLIKEKRDKIDVIVRRIETLAKRKVLLDNKNK